MLTDCCRPIEAPAGIELWQLDLDVPIGRAELAVLSADEQVRAARFARGQDRARFSHAHVLLRHLLARRCGARPDALRFVAGAHGKPEVAGLETGRFSLSHSAGVALVALGGALEVGVDLELVRPIDDATELAEAHCAASERRALMRLHEAQRDLAFLRIWTRKEACLKALGLGLGLPLGDVEVGHEPAARTVDIASGSLQHRFELRSFESAAPAWVGALAWRAEDQR
jgi:4'-phosphopantetheinyl transferase